MNRTTGPSHTAAVAVDRRPGTRRAISAAAARLPSVRDIVLSVATLRNLVLGFYVFSITAPRAFSPVPVDAALNPAIDAQGSTFNQLVLISCFVLSVIVVWRLGTHGARIVKAAIPYLPLVLLAVASIAWAAFPDLSARRVMRVAMELATITLLVSAFPNKAELIRVLLWSLALVVVLDLVSLGSPQAHTPLGFGGINADKNAVGESTFVELPIFGMAILDRRIVRRRVIPVLLFAAAVFLLAISLSKTAVSTSMICFMVVAVAGAYKSRWRWPVMAVVLIIVLTAFTLAVAMGFDMGDISTVMTGSPSFSGRQLLWDYTNRRIAESPFIGHGYGSVWGVVSDKAVWLQTYHIYFDANQAHNGYLDVMLQLGIVGVVAMTYAIIMEIVRLVRTIGRQGIDIYILFAVHLVVGFLIYNMTESLYFRASSSLWVFYLIACMSISLPQAAPTPKGGPRIARNQGPEAYAAHRLAG